MNLSREASLAVAAEAISATTMEREQPISLEVGCNLLSLTEMMVQATFEVLDSNKASALLEAGDVMIAEPPSPLWHNLTSFLSSGRLPEKQEYGIPAFQHEVQNRYPATVQELLQVAEANQIDGQCLIDTACIYARHKLEQQRDT